MTEADMYIIVTFEKTSFNKLKIQFSMKCIESFMIVLFVLHNILCFQVLSQIIRISKSIIFAYCIAN